MALVKNVHYFVLTVNSDTVGPDLDKVSVWIKIVMSNRCRGSLDHLPSIHVESICLVLLKMKGIMASLGFSPDRRRDLKRTIDLRNDVSALASVDWLFSENSSDNTRPQKNSSKKKKKRLRFNTCRLEEGPYRQTRRRLIPRRARVSFFFAVLEVCGSRRGLLSDAARCGKVPFFTVHSQQPDVSSKDWRLVMKGLPNEDWIETVMEGRRCTTQRLVQVGLVCLSQMFSYSPKGNFLHMYEFFLSGEVPLFIFK